MRSKTMLRRGNITIILLGLISVMLIMVIALSKRMTGHTQLLTLSDYTQITRYFLESYSGDVLQQLGVEINRPGSNMFKAFRDPAAQAIPSNTFYQPSDMLKKLGKELNIELKLPPEITFSRSEPLEYPPGFDCPNPLKGKEKKGLLEIVCKARFQGREYTLRVQYPFTVVSRMVPILKDFFLFVDRISREQGHDKIGPEDNINILFTKGGKHPPELQHGTINHNTLKPGFKYRPWVLLPPLDMIEHRDSKVSGRVFLGASNQTVYLNLAGDTREVANNPEAATNADEINASVGEMFLVPPEVFKVAEESDNRITSDYIPVFVDRDNRQIRMKGVSVPLKYDHTAKMGMLGFSLETVPDSEDSIFAGSAYTASDFFNSGSNAGQFWQKLEGYGQGYMSMASGLKLMGPSPDNFVLGAPNREVFGNVLSRFFVLTFWWPPSYGGQPLQYDEGIVPGFFPSITRGRVTYKFEPLYSHHNYQHFMSRMVSGKLWNPSSGPDSLPDDFMAYNADVSRKTKRIFLNNDFNANDGFRATESLDRLGRRWFEIAQRAGDKPGRGIESRIGRSFFSGEEFRAAVGVDKDMFQVNGVVYVSGPLKVPDLNMTNDRIGGGIVLVDGPIEINNITRGYNLDTNQFKLGPYGNMFFSGPAHESYQKWKTEISQDSFLTFVSLSGDPITIKGELLIGVHLINLRDKHNRSYDQIKWELDGSKEIVFCGGIAANYLNLPARMREFGEIRSSCNLLGAPFFMYHSAMSAPEPSFAVQMMENMRGYMLTASRVD